MRKLGRFTDTTSAFTGWAVSWWALRKVAARDFADGIPESAIVLDAGVLHTKLAEQKRGDRERVVIREGALPAQTKRGSVVADMIADRSGGRAEFAALVGARLRAAGGGGGLWDEGERQRVVALLLSGKAGDLEKSLAVSGVGATLEERRETVTVTIARASPQESLRQRRQRAEAGNASLSVGISSARAEDEDTGVVSHADDAVQRGEDVELDMNDSDAVLITMMSESRRFCAARRWPSSASIFICRSKEATGNSGTHVRPRDFVDSIIKHKSLVWMKRANGGDPSMLVPTIVVLMIMVADVEFLRAVAAGE